MIEQPAPNVPKCPTLPANGDRGSASPKPFSLGWHSVWGVERKGSAERINDVLRPGEAIIAQLSCQTGKWVSESGTNQIAAVTSHRFLLFRATFPRSKNSGQLLNEIDLKKVRNVGSKTAHFMFLIPNVRTRLECADGHAIQIVSSGKDAKKARSFANLLSDRVEAARQNTEEASP